MKRILSLLMVCFMALTLSAQRAAVLEFKAGAGISQADVDGISAIFITYFRPEGYTMVERTQIDRIISEQNMQRSNLTESQMIRIGQLLKLSRIVIGEVNVIMGEYNVDVRVINVESGAVIATAGKAMTGSYGENMRTLAQTLADKIAIKPRSTVPVGYVDLGLPSGTLWKDRNEDGGFYDYNQAIAKFGSKLPTKKQFEELISSCQWNRFQKNGIDGYNVKGPNGNSIFLPAECPECGDLRDFMFGSYWSSTPYGSDHAWVCTFGIHDVNVMDLGRVYNRSIRLIY